MTKVRTDGTPGSFFHVTDDATWLAEGQLFASIPVPKDKDQPPVVEPGMQIRCVTCGTIIWCFDTHVVSFSPQ